MDTGILMSSTKCDQMSKKRASFALGERKYARRIVNAIAPSAIDQCLPRGRARADIMEVRVIGLGDALQEERVGRIADVKRFENGERLIGLVLVPDVDHVTLEVGFAAQQIPAHTGLVDLLQSFRTI